MSNEKQAQDDQWRPVRTHAVLRPIQRGPGKSMRFIGQQEDEQLRRVVREHPIFYISSAVPLLLALILLGLVTWLEARNVLPVSFFPPLYLLTVLAVIGAILYGIYRIFELWWVNVYIITDKRVLTRHGLLNPTRDETTLDKVQQVGVDQGLAGLLLSYGSVHIYLAGGKQIRLKRVPDPRGVRDDIEGIWQSYKATKPARPARPPLADRAPSARLEKLAAREPLPRLPDADARWEDRRSPTGVRGPLRRFGGPLRLECDVHYDAEEHTVLYVQRSREVLAIRLIPPLALLLATLFAALMVKAAFNLFLLVFFVILLLVALTIINFIDDVFILTNKRVIDINRRFGILSEQHDTTTYDKISKIEVRIPNVIQLALDVGSLYIETQGNNPNIHMRSIPHPNFIQDKIYEIKNFNEKVDKIKAKNEMKDELDGWFSTILTTMRGVPDLQSLDLLTALERAGELGMEVVVVDESTRRGDVDAGKIVMQTPTPGTVVYVDPDNPQERPLIQVILSE